MMGKSQRKTLFRSERGASLVEMALVSIFLLFLVAGIVDFGFAYNNFIVITNAAREGARYGSKFPYDGDGIRAAVKQEAGGNGLTVADGDISIVPDPATPAASGAPITVTVTYTYTTLLGGFVGAEQLPLRSRTEMIVFGVD